MDRDRSSLECRTILVQEASRSVFRSAERRREGESEGVTRCPKGFAHAPSTRLQSTPRSHTVFPPGCVQGDSAAELVWLERGGHLAQEHKADTKKHLSRAQKTGYAPPFLSRVSISCRRATPGIWYPFDRFLYTVTKRPRRTPPPTDCPARHAQKAVRDSFLCDYASHRRGHHRHFPRRQTLGTLDEPRRA
jgi:hypothetical protein